MTNLNSRQNSACSGSKFSSESKLFGGCHPCSRATSATLVSKTREEDTIVKADTSCGEEEQETAEPAHPHPDWVICPRSLCRVMRGRLQQRIKEKRPCNLCGAKQQDDCVCEPCEDCNMYGECCNNCVCCKVNFGDVNVTPNEWKAFFASQGMDLPTNFLETYEPPFCKL